MSIKFTILLYSKYSKFSTNIISTINQYQNIFVENFNIKLLCIDNENIRKRILNSKKINITGVPSILVIYNDGGVENYENNDAFNWVDEIIKRALYLQKQQNTSNTVEEQYLEENFDDELEEDIEPEPINIPSPKNLKNRHQNKSRPQIQSQSKPGSKNQQPKLKPQLKPQTSKKQILINKTSIEDLEDLEDIEDLEHDENIQENFEFKNDIEQIESTNALSEKRNDLLSIAAEMQKNRDNFVETTDKPKRIPFDR